MPEQKYYIPSLNSEIITENKQIESKGAASIEFIRVAASSSVSPDDVTINDGIRLTDNYQDWIWVNPPHMKIRQRINIAFDGKAGTMPMVIVNKYFYEEVTEEQFKAMQ